MDNINIMISFLSPLREDQNNKGHILTQLYEGLMGDGLGKTHSTNESGLRFILQQLNGEGRKLDYYLCLTTDTVENGKQDFLQERTHYEYFSVRMQEIFNTCYGADTVIAEDVLKKIHYPETGADGMILAPITETVDFVRKLRKNQNGCQVNIYLDLTGGPRDANMLLLILSRMLEYDEGVKICEVIYSALNNKKGEVRIITGAFNLLDMVAGMSEFANFGSTNALDKYFAGSAEKNSSLYRLREAMHDFSDKIRLCRYGEFTESVKQLKNQLDGFVQDTEGKNNNDIQIAFSFLDEIRKKYGTLFAAVEKNTADKDLQLIKWCIDNDCIQQAMTLITERVPEYYFGAGILAVADKAKESFQKNYDKYKNDSKANRASENYWLLSLNTDGQITKKNIYNQLAEAVKQDFSVMCQQKKKYSGTGKSNRENISNLKERTKEITIKYSCFSVIDSEDAEKNLQELYEYLSNGIREIYDFNNIRRIRILENLKKHTDILLQEKYSKRDIIEKILQPILQNKIEIESEKLTEIIGIEIKEYPGNFDAVKNQLELGKLTTPYVQADVLQSLLLYFEIKAERNAINHAHDEKEQITFDELKNKINLLLDFLEGFRN